MRNENRQFGAVMNMGNLFNSLISWCKLAARNLVKNGRRSLFTVLAIGLGYAAVNVFGGFTKYIFTGLAESYIYAQANGHLTIFKNGFLSHGKVDPARYMLSQVEVQSIQAVLRSFPQVLLVTSQLHISGLLSNGEVSTVFIGVGRVPSDVRLINGYAQGMVGRIKLFTGRPLEDTIVFGVGLSSGLAKQLNLVHGSDGMAIAPTMDGQINALDVQVFHLFDAPFEILNDTLMVVPLAFAQSLYSTKNVDRLIILFEDTEQTEPMRIVLAQVLAHKGLDVEIKTWNELNVYYTKVKDMFSVIFIFLFVIVFVIVVMSIINTVSMAVMERTREIGTLRALGTQRRGIMTLFSIESLMLGVLGALLGFGLTLMSWVIVKVMEPTWIPPMIPMRVPLEVHLVPEYLILSLMVLLLLTLVAAIPPVRKAVRMNIVEALGHV